jgi:hypothetical protein
MTIHCTSTDIQTIHQALQDNYQLLSRNALHFSYRTNKHLRNLRPFTRTPLDIVTLITNLRTLRMHQRTRRNRQRNIIWFNPPFSKSVNTNIGREFLSLIDNHFPLQHKLHKIFNRNTLKMSYSCMNNVKSIITKHNAHIITNSQSQNTETDNCNCDNKNTCPLPKQCMTNNIIYKATVTTNNTNDIKHYIGMTASRLYI